MMKEECLICGAPLEYLETDEMMECAVCRAAEVSFDWGRSDPNG